MGGDHRYHCPVSRPGGIDVKAPKMRDLRRTLIRLVGLLRKEQRERELAEEFESHLAMHVEDNLRRGMSPSQAWREARLKFGSIDSAKESMREGATFLTLETTLQDLRFAVRGL